MRLMVTLLIAPVLFVAWCLRGIVRFRLCIVGAQRFGHLALEPEMWLASSQSDSKVRLPRTVDLWSFGSPRMQSNAYLTALWARRIRIIPSWIVGALVRAGGMMPKLALEQARLSIHGPANGLDKVPQQCPPVEGFTHMERELLQSFGFDVDRPYVALVIRDSAYYNSRGETEDPYLSLLNADLEKFLPACEHLLSLGFQVVRLGGPSPQKMGNVQGFFDYANSNIRTAELDVKLPMKCAFTVSTQTGPDALSLLARRPVLYIDVIRVSQFFLGTTLATWAPVQFIEPKTGEPWSLNKFCSTSLLAAKDPRQFALPDTKFVKVGANELRDIVADYVHELNNGVSEDVANLRSRVNRLLAAGMGSWGEARFGEVTSQVSRRWLIHNKEWWLPEN